MGIVPGVGGSLEEMGGREHGSVTFNLIVILFSSGAESNQCIHTKE